MNKIHKNLILISRILVGIVFIYSGFVKAVDPLGSTYKFNDYFTAFNTNWAASFSFFLSVFQSIAELVIGASVLLNLKIKQGAWGAFLLMVFFTPLTLILAIKNPVHDCGCFGDALILTNWQTFWKNVVLFIPVLYIFIQRQKIDNILKCWEQWIGIGVITIFSGIIISYSYQHLPLLDFRPYKIGTHIPEKMSIPDGAPVDVYESTFIYSKDGVEKNFDINNLPDSTWQFIDAIHTIVKKGYEPPIHDFTIATLEGDELTDLMLASDNYSFFLISHNLDKYSYSEQAKIDSLYLFCQQNGYNFYGLTSSSEERINEFIDETKLAIEFFNTDDITLKTIIRSNPGLLLMKSGTILDKWHYNDIPNFESLKTDLNAYVISKYKKTGDNYYILLLIISSGLMITLYLLIRKLICRKNTF